MPAIQIMLGHVFVLLNVSHYVLFDADGHAARGTFKKSLIYSGTKDRMYLAQITQWRINRLSTFGTRQKVWIQIDIRFRVCIDSGRSQLWGKLSNIGEFIINPVLLVNAGSKWGKDWDKHQGAI